MDFYNLSLSWNIHFNYLCYHSDNIDPAIAVFESLTCTLMVYNLSVPAANLQEKLTDFLPKLLDCSTEIKSFHDPPKLPGYSTLELCERFSCIMAALCRVTNEGR